MLVPFHERVRSEIERLGGRVEKFIGDAVMALFGAPVAHGDDPERSVLAALAVRDAVAELNGEHGFDLSVRIGVATGEAIVALGARPEEGEGMAAGDVVNTGFRLAEVAPVDGIVVDAATRGATRHAIDYRPVDPVQVKGKASPLRLWEATGRRVDPGDAPLRRCLADARSSPSSSRRPCTRPSLSPSSVFRESARAAWSRSSLRSSTLPGPRSAGCRGARCPTERRRRSGLSGRSSRRTPASSAPTTPRPPRPSSCGQYETCSGTRPPPTASSRTSVRWSVSQVIASRAVHATRRSPRGTASSRRSRGASASCSCSRTSTGRTRDCSSSSTTLPLR